MSFAQWVRDTRLTRRISIVECASRAGVSHPTWIEYENVSKAKQPKRQTVMKIAEALGVEVAEALRVAGYQTEPIEIPVQLLNAWYKVSRASEANQAAWLDSVGRSADMAISL